MTDILAHSYRYIYLFMVAILSAPIIMRYKTSRNNQTLTYPNNTFRDMLLLVILILFIGLRPVSSVFSDMVAYSKNLSTKGFGDFCFSWDVENKIFDNLYGFWISENLGDTSFFLLMAIIYFVATYLGIRKICPEHVYPVFLTFLAAFSTFSYATNGIKAGAAASIFVMALGYWDKLIVCIPLMLVSLGFHHSMVMPIAAYFVSVILKKPK